MIKKVSIFNQNVTINSNFLETSYFFCTLKKIRNFKGIILAELPDSIVRLPLLEDLFDIGIIC